MGDRVSNLTIDGVRLIKDLKVTELKSELEERGLSKYGNKRELVQRLSIFEENRQKSTGQQNQEAPNQWLENEADLNNDFLREYFKSQKALFQEQVQRKNQIGVSVPPQESLPSPPASREAPPLHPHLKDAPAKSGFETAAATSTLLTPVLSAKKSRGRKRKEILEPKCQQLTPLKIYSEDVVSPNPLSSRPSRSSAQASRALSLASFEDEEDSLDRERFDPYSFEAKPRKRGGHRSPRGSSHRRLSSSTANSETPPPFKPCPTSEEKLSESEKSHKVPSLKIKLPESVPKSSTSNISPVKENINSKIKFMQDEFSKQNVASKTITQICLSPQNAEVSSSVQEEAPSSLSNKPVHIDSHADSTSNSSSESENHVSDEQKSDNESSVKIMTVVSLKSRSSHFPPKPRLLSNNQHWVCEEKKPLPKSEGSPSSRRKVKVAKFKKEIPTEVSSLATISRESSNVQSNMEIVGKYVNRPKFKEAVESKPTRGSTRSRRNVQRGNVASVKNLDISTPQIVESPLCIETKLKKDLVNLRLRDESSSSKDTSTSPRLFVKELPSPSNLDNLSLRRSSRISKHEKKTSKDHKKVDLLKSNYTVLKPLDRKSSSQTPPPSQLLDSKPSANPDFIESLKQQIEMPLHVEKFPLCDKSEVTSTSELCDSPKENVKKKIEDPSPSSYQSFPVGAPVLNARIAVAGHLGSSFTPDSRGVDSSTSDDLNINKINPPSLSHSYLKNKPTNIDSSPKMNTRKPELKSPPKKSGYLIENLIDNLSEKAGSKCKGTVKGVSANQVIMDKKKETTILSHYKTVTVGSISSEPKIPLKLQTKLELNQPLKSICENTETKDVKLDSTFIESDSLKSSAIKEVNKEIPSELHDVGTILKFIEPHKEEIPIALPTPKASSSIDEMSSHSTSALKDSLSLLEKAFQNKERRVSQESQESNKSFQDILKEATLAADIMEEDDLESESFANFISQDKVILNPYQNTLPLKKMVIPSINSNVVLKEDNFAKSEVLSETSMKLQAKESTEISDNIFNADTESESSSSTFKCKNLLKILERRKSEPIKDECKKLNTERKASEMSNDSSNIGSQRMPFWDKNLKFNKKMEKESCKVSGIEIENVEKEPKLLEELGLHKIIPGSAKTEPVTEESKVQKTKPLPLKLQESVHELQKVSEAKLVPDSSSLSTDILPPKIIQELPYSSIETSDHKKISEEIKTIWREGSESKHIDESSVETDETSTVKDNKMLLVEKVVCIGTEKDDSLVITPNLKGMETDVSKPLLIKHRRRSSLLSFDTALNKDKREASCHKVKDDKIYLNDPLLEIEKEKYLYSSTIDIIKDNKMKENLGQSEKGETSKLIFKKIHADCDNIKSKTDSDKQNIADVSLENMISNQQAILGKDTVKTEVTSELDSDEKKSTSIVQKEKSVTTTEKIMARDNTPNISVEKIILPKSHINMPVTTKNEKKFVSLNQNNFIITDETSTNTSEQSDICEKKKPSTQNMIIAKANEIIHVKTNTKTPIYMKISTTDEKKSVCTYEETENIDKIIETSAENIPETTVGKMNVTTDEKFVTSNEMKPLTTVTTGIKSSPTMETKSLDTIVEKSPVTTVEKKPTTTLKKSPATTIEDNPATTVEKSSPTMEKKSPAPTSGKSSMITVKKMPVTVKEKMRMTSDEKTLITTDEKRLVTTYEKSPVTINEKSSITTDGTSPITTDEKSPETIDEKSPASAEEKNPIATGKKSPVATAEKGPVATAEKSPVATAEKTPVATAEKSPVSVVENSVSTVEKTPVTIVEKTPVTTVEKTPVTTVEKSPVTTVEKRPVINIEKTPVISMEKRPFTTGEKRSITTREKTSVTTVEKTPVTTVEKTPVTTIEKTPVTTMEKTSGTTVEKSPVTNVEKSPVTTVEKSLVTTMEKTPVTTMEKTPGTTVEKSPVTTVEKSPVTTVEKSPVATVEKSPVTTVEKSPVTYAEKSPVTTAEKCPVTTAEKSPLTIVEKSPLTIVEKSPVTIMEKSPVATGEKTPVTTVEKTPVTTTEKTPVTTTEKSPVTIVEKSPLTIVEKSPVTIVEKSPVTTVEKSPVTTVEKSPVTTVEKSPVTTVEKSPVTTVEKSPVTTVEKSPVTIVEKTPVTTVEKTPVTNVEKTPVSTVKKTPVSTVEKTPVTTVEKTPVTTVEKTSVSTVEKSPVATLEKSPVATLEKSPVATLEKSLVATLEKIPVATLEKSPVATLEKSPVATLEKSPVATLEKSPVATLEKSPVATLEKSPFTTFEKSPVTTMEKTPVTTVKKSPVTIVDKSQVTIVEKGPVTTVEKNPVTTLEKTPVATVKKTPVTTVEKTPVTTVEKTPVTTVEKTPVTTVEKTPVTTVENNPVAILEKSLVATLEKSSVTTVEKNPVTTIEKSPVTTVEKNPVATLEKSPVATFEKIPVATLDNSPVATLENSAVVTLEKTPVATLEKTPVSTVEKTPVSTVEKTPVSTVGKSPVSTVEKTPVAILEKTSLTTVEKTPLTTVQKSPLTTVEKTPVTTMEKTPVTNVGKSPVATVEKSPIASLEKSPVTTLEKTPITTVEKTTITTVEKTPITTVEKTPITTVKKSPVSTVEKTLVTTVEISPVTFVEKCLVTTVENSPVATLKMSPVATLEKSPVATLKKSPVATLEKSPVATLEKSPVATLEKRPVATLEKSLVATLEKSPVATLENSPVATDVKSSVTTFEKNPVTTNERIQVNTVEKTPVTTEKILVTIDEKSKMIKGEKILGTVEEKFPIVIDAKIPATNKISIITYGKIPVTTKEKNSVTIEENSLLPNEKSVTGLKSSGTTDMKSLATADGKGSVTTDQKSSVSTDQKSSVSTDQKSSVSTDQKSSVSTDQKISVTADENIPMTSDNVVSVDKNPVLTDEEIMKTSYKKMPVTLNVDKSIPVSVFKCTSDEQENSASSNATNILLTTSETKLLASNEKKSITVDDKSCLEIKPICTSTEKSASSYNEKLLTTLTSSFEIKPIAKADKSPTSVKEKNETVSYKELQMIYDKNDPKDFSDKKPSIRTDENPFFDDQKKPTLSLDEKELTKSKEMLLVATHDKGKDTNVQDKKPSTAFVEKKLINSDQGKFFATDNMKPMTSDKTDITKPMTSDKLQPLNVVVNENTLETSDTSIELFIKKEGEAIIEQNKVNVTVDEKRINKVGTNTNSEKSLDSVVTAEKETLDVRKAVDIYATTTNKIKVKTKMMTENNTIRSSSSNQELSTDLERKNDFSFKKEIKPTDEFEPVHKKNEMVCFNDQKINILHKNKSITLMTSANIELSATLMESIATSKDEEDLLRASMKPKDEKDLLTASMKQTLTDGETIVKKFEACSENLSKNATCTTTKENKDKIEVIDVTDIEVKKNNEKYLLPKETGNIALDKNNFLCDVIKLESSELKADEKIIHTSEKDVSSKKNLCTTDKEKVDLSIDNQNDGVDCIDIKVPQNGNKISTTENREILTKNIENIIDTARENLISNKKQSMLLSSNKADISTQCEKESILHTSMSVAKSTIEIDLLEKTKIISKSVKQKEASIKVSTITGELHPKDKMSYTTKMVFGTAKRKNEDSDHVKSKCQLYEFGDAAPLTSVKVSGISLKSDNEAVIDGTFNEAQIRTCALKESSSDSGNNYLKTDSEFLSVKKRKLSVSDMSKEIISSDMDILKQNVENEQICSIENKVGSDNVMPESDKFDFKNNKITTDSESLSVSIGNMTTLPDKNRNTVILTTKELLSTCNLNPEQDSSYSHTSTSVIDLQLHEVSKADSLKSNSDLKVSENLQDDEKVLSSKQDVTEDSTLSYRRDGSLSVSNIENSGTDSKIVISETWGKRFSSGKDSSRFSDNKECTFRYGYKKDLQKSSKLSLTKETDIQNPNHVYDILTSTLDKASSSNKVVQEKDESEGAQISESAVRKHPFDFDLSEIQLPAEKKLTEKKKVTPPTLISSLKKGKITTKDIESKFFSSKSSVSVGSSGVDNTAAEKNNSSKDRPLARGKECSYAIKVAKINFPLKSKGSVDESSSQSKINPLAMDQDKSLILEKKEQSIVSEKGKKEEKTFLPTIKTKLNKKVMDTKFSSQSMAALLNLREKLSEDYGSQARSCNPIVRNKANSASNECDSFDLSSIPLPPLEPQPIKETEVSLILLSSNSDAKEENVGQVNQMARSKKSETNTEVLTQKREDSNGDVSENMNSLNEIRIPSGEKSNSPPADKDSLPPAESERLLLKSKSTPLSTESKETVERNVSPLTVKQDAEKNGTTDVDEKKPEAEEPQAEETPSGAPNPQPQQDASHETDKKKGDDKEKEERDPDNKDNDRKDQHDEDAGKSKEKSEDVGKSHKSTESSKSSRDKGRSSRRRRSRSTASPYRSRRGRSRSSSLSRSPSRRRSTRTSQRSSFKRSRSSDRRRSRDRDSRRTRPHSRDSRRGDSSRRRDSKSKESSKRSSSSRSKNEPPSKKDSKADDATKKSSDESKKKLSKESKEENVAATVEAAPEGMKEDAPRDKSGTEEEGRIEEVENGEITEEKKEEKEEEKREKEKTEVAASVNVTPFKSARKVSLSRTKSQEDDKDKPKKKKWGASAATKPSLEISSFSLKSLMPDVKPLSPSELTLQLDSGKESEEESEEEREEKEEELPMGEDEAKEDEVKRKTKEDSDEDQEDRKKEISLPRRRRSLSKERPRRRREEGGGVNARGVSPHFRKRHSALSPDRSPPLTRKIRIVESGPSTSVKLLIKPARNPVSKVIQLQNLVRPFTIKQLKDLLQRTGRLVDNGFWIDSIKSKCLAMYESEDQAQETRMALHGVKWPTINPKNLYVDFSSEEELKKKMAETAYLQPQIQADEPKRDRRRVDGPVREWDLAKLGERSPGEREREKERQRREREEERIREREKLIKTHPGGKEKSSKKAAVKSLDDLFKKTKAKPSIYWLPLSTSQIAEKEAQRRKRIDETERLYAEMKLEREKQRAEREKEEEKRRQKRKEREKEREKEKSSRRSRSRSKRRSRSRSTRSPRRSPRRSRRSASRDTRKSRKSKSHSRSSSRSRS